MQNARHVAISPQHVKKTAEYLRKIPPVAWDSQLHYFDGSGRGANWLFALDAANFSFWPDPGAEKWSLTYNGEKLDGYNALAAAFKRAVEEGFALWNPAFLAALPEQRLRFILRGNGGIPLLRERLHNVREVGKVLLEKFEGGAETLLKLAGGSAARFATLLAENFPSFEDSATYDGLRVPFYKRAQLLASDLHLAFGGKSLGHFHDMEVLTAFADYKIPQILRELGVLIYDETLAAVVDAQQAIPAGSQEEVEIRSATIQAVEEICVAAQSLGDAVFPHQVDARLWQASQAFSENAAKPYHRTRTTAY